MRNTPGTFAIGQLCFHADDGLDASGKSTPTTLALPTQIFLLFPAEGQFP